MILDFFNLREQPFGVTPDPRFWFASETHREALASLEYGLESKLGFVALIARPGMGKTSLLFNGLGRISRRARTVFLYQQLKNAKSLLRAVLDDLGVAETEGSLIALQRKLTELCAEQARCGKRLVLVIDEAQSLDESVLEFLRMLSNFETPREKLIQIVLSGQLQLAERMASAEMTQLRQRISILAHLKPLSESETADYVNHRLRIAGSSSGSDLFTASALSLVARQSQGIPRNINNLCFNAMSIAFALKRKTIDCDAVSEAIADLSLESYTANARENPQSFLPAPPADRVAASLSQPAERRERQALEEVALRRHPRLTGAGPMNPLPPAIFEVFPGSGSQSTSNPSLTSTLSLSKPLFRSRPFTPILRKERAPRRSFSFRSAYSTSAAGFFTVLLLCSLALAFRNRSSGATNASANVSAALPAEIDSSLSNAGSTHAQSSLIPAITIQSIHPLGEIFHEQKL